MLSGTPFVLILRITSKIFTWSKAFVKPIKQRYAELCLFSLIFLTTNITSVVNCYWNLVTVLSLVVLVWSNACKEFRRWHQHRGFFLFSIVSSRIVVLHFTLQALVQFSSTFPALASFITLLNSFPIYWLISSLPYWINLLSDSLSQKTFLIRVENFFSKLSLVKFTLIYAFIIPVDKLCDTLLIECCRHWPDMDPSLIWKYRSAQLSQHYTQDEFSL